MKYYNLSVYTILPFIYIVHTAHSQKSAALIGGRETLASEAKYLVSLQNHENEHFCGGSIIADRFVLTAAHCVIDDEDEFYNETIKIVAGTNDLHAKDSTSTTTEVEKVYVPAHYNDLEWTTSIPRGDIAVLKLKDSLNLKSNGNLKKLRLPRAKRHKRYKTYVGEEVFIAGFGWDKVKVTRPKKNMPETEIGSSADRLFGANAKVISNAECRRYYTHTIRESELCAKVIEHDDDTPQGVCRGDSGSPLVHKNATIIGVVNGISIGCNENNEPGLYCRVSSYMKFIKNAMRDNVRNMRTNIY